MELIVGTESLRNELRSFSGLVDKGSLMEMSNLLIETKDDKLLITGGDGDVTLRAELTGDHFEEVSPGALCVKANKLIDVLGTLDGNVKSVRFKEEANGWTNLLFGRSHSRISGIKHDLYPDVTITSKPDTETIKFPAGLLLQFFNSTSHAVSNQDTKFLLTGANLVVTETGAQMTSADGFRIASIKSPVTGVFSSVFPKKAMSILSRLLAEVSPEVLVELAAEQNHIFASIGNKRLSFRKMVGDFPDVTGPLSVVNDQKVLLSLYELRSAVRRADIFADKNNQNSVTMTIRPGEVEIHAKSFEEGSTNEFIAATYEGPEIKIRIKSNFLTDFFSSVAGEGPDLTLALEFSAEPKTPTIWKVHREANVELGYDYACLITKLR